MTKRASRGDALRTLRNWVKAPSYFRRGLDQWRHTGPAHRHALKREQLLLVDRLILHEFRERKPPSNPVLVERYYNEYRNAIALENGKRDADKRLATGTKATFTDYVKAIGAFYRDRRWRSRHLNHL